MSTELTLVYFNAKGLAEVSRLLLALAQVQYTDKTYPIEVVDPVKHIYIRDEFDSDRKDGKFVKSPGGRLPLLHVGDNITIPQSKAIERYLAKRYNMMGTDLIEEARIDAVCECVRDIKERYFKIKSSSPDQGGDPGALLEDEFMGLQNVLDLEKPWAIGDNLSLADVTIYHLVTQFYDNKEAVKIIAASIPKIRDIVIKVGMRPEISTYITNRPFTKF